MNEQEFMSLNLAKMPIPKPTEKRTKDDTVMVPFGIGNTYPNFLLYLYHNCPIHASIINTKAAYIIGDGLRLKSGGEFNIQPNVSETLSEFLNKIVTDFLIHNSFAIETQYNELTFDKETLSFNHIPTHSVRTNNSKSKFWFSENYEIQNGEFTWDRWSKYNSDAKSKLYYSDGYISSVNRNYSLPDYIACIESIMTDISISGFNRNNIEGNFSASKLVTYYLGANSDPNEREKIRRNWEKYFTGEGRKIMFNFANPGQDQVKIENIDSNTWDKAYESVSAKIEQRIFRGHSISESLLGESTPGKLGNSQELEAVYQLFKNNYVQNKRNHITSALSTLFGVEVEFKDRPITVGKIPDNLLQLVLTINEIRAIENRPPISDGDRLLAPAPTQAPQQPQALITQTQHFHKEFRLTSDDFEKVKDMGTPKLNFEFICMGGEEEMNKIEIKFDTESDIADYVLNNDIKGLTINQLKVLIRKDLGLEITTKELNRTLSSLNDAGVIKSTINDGIIDIKPPIEPKVPPSRSVQVLYSYEVKPGLGAPVIPTSRDFCIKLVENDRYYSRTEIQTMTEIFGYDIFKFTGGYYYNPDTQETTKSCRHFWQSTIVTPKNN